MYDLIVVGGGAAGFFAAISYAELAEESVSVLILEKSPEVLQKVSISGGGRCNVTHDCHDPREFVTYYPRGEKTLPGPFHQWNAADMMDWLEARGIELKVENDGRIFPTTDDSQTIIDCFLNEAEQNNIEIRCRETVTSVDKDNDSFVTTLNSGEEILSQKLLLATGGIRNVSGQEIAESFGHSVLPAAPSLFTFRISDKRIEELAGISVASGSAKVVDTNLAEVGPVLITHWGLSGPAILKLSARAARELQARNYKFHVAINWTDQPNFNSVFDRLMEFGEETGRQSVKANSKFGVPSRLWRSLCESVGISADLKWANASKAELSKLANELAEGRFKVTGKSMNKDEFVTCGGINLKEVDFKTMQSKLVSGLYFAGEVLDIDGVTGGFNFQSAWTTGRIVGKSLAS